MRILVAGTRGIPNIMGGVETHCEALYSRLAKENFSITIVRRINYVSKDDQLNSYNGIKLFDIYSPRSKSLEAIIHTILAVFYAKIKGFKVMHIHSIGPSIAIPLARLLGLKIIMTHHGPDYDRQKWGFLAKKVLKVGEWCAANFANEIIVISNTINDILKKKYNRHDAHLIHNGVIIPETSKAKDYIESINLEPKKYILAVGRFVPEKGFHDLIKAYKISKIDLKLVLVGDADHKDKYSENLKYEAKKSGIFLTGFITGEKLNQIYSNAALIVIPSYHEGLPIVLLEAMSYNLKLVVSNISANLNVDIDDNAYFRVGDAVHLAQKITEKLENNSNVNYRRILKSKYNWDLIALQTKEVYSKLMKL